jgi:hypothetical protein
MTHEQFAARKKVRKLSLHDIGRRLNTVADRFLALWAGDDAAAKRSLIMMGAEPQLKEMLLLAVNTVVSRRRRRIDYELDGFRIRWPGR